MTKAALKIILIAMFGLMTRQSIALQESPADSMLKSSRKTEKIDKETLRRNISETMDSIEALATQMKTASPAEKIEIRASGKRDFYISKGYISDILDSVDCLLKAFAADDAIAADKTALKGLAPETPEEQKLMKKLRGDEEKAKDLRSDARDAIRPLHKSENENYIRTVRNWIMVCEGSLRHDHPADANYLESATSTAKTKP